MRKDYHTIQGYGESEIIIQKSRFLTYVSRAETEQQAQDFINNIKGKVKFIIWNVRTKKHKRKHC